MAEAAVQIQRFVYVTPMSSWVRTQNILINFGKHIMQFSRFSKGDLLLMRVLIGRTLALIAWQQCINVRLRYFCCILAATRRRESRDISSLFLKEHCGRVECLHACVWFKKDSSLYLTGTLWPKHSINQHGKEGSKEGRSWGPSSSKESDEGHIHPRQGWIAAIQKKDLTFV